VDEKELKNNIPCIVDNGILFNPKDIQKILRDLGQVTYSYIINDQIEGTGEGYIVSVVANNSSANMIVNKRIYINVSGFDYMNLINEDNQAIIEMVSYDSILRFVPANNQIEDISNSSILLTHSNELSDEEFDEAFAEINFDDDLDED